MQFYQSQVLGAYASAEKMSKDRIKPLSTEIFDASTH